jgi:hypothetical protein
MSNTQTSKVQAIRGGERSGSVQRWNDTWNRKENAELEQEMGAQVHISLSVPAEWAWTEAHEESMRRKLDLVSAAAVRMAAGMAKGTMKYKVDFSQYSLQEFVEFVFDETADLMNLVSALKEAVMQRAGKASGSISVRPAATGEEALGDRPGLEAARLSEALAALEQTEKA